MEQESVKTKSDFVHSEEVAAAHIASILERVRVLCEQTPWYRRVNMETYLMKVKLMLFIVLVDIWQAQYVIAAVCACAGALLLFEMSRRTITKFYRLPMFAESISNMRLHETAKLTILCNMLRDSRDDDPSKMPDDVRKAVSGMYGDAKAGLVQAMRIHTPYHFTGAPTSLPLQMRD